MALFNLQTMISSPGTYMAERFTSSIVMTHAQRMERITTLQIEVQVLLDRVSNLKQVEDTYLSELGYFPASPINDDGTPGRNPFSTLPEFDKNTRSISFTNVKDSYPLEDSILKHQSGKVYNEPRYTVFRDEALLKLRSEDRYLRKIENQIKSARLAAERKRLQLEQLINERSDVAAAREVSNG